VLTRLGEEIEGGAARVPVGAGVGDVIGAVEREVAALTHGHEVGGIATLAARRVAAAAEMRHRQHHTRSGAGVTLAVHRIAAIEG
jgi:hypothetical protein